MLKNIYPQHQEGVAFFAIGMDPSETLTMLEGYRKEQGYPWPVAMANSEIFPRYRVLIRSTKIAIDRNGVITWRAGYGIEEAAQWHQVLGALAASP